MRQSQTSARCFSPKPFYFFLCSCKYYSITMFILSASTLLYRQFIAFFGPTESNPLLVTFPLDYSVQRATLPPQRLWCLISVAIHIDLWRSIFPDEHGLTSLNGFDIPPTPLLYSYGFATMAPMLSMLLRCPWQTVAWWSVPAAMVTIVHVVKNTITQGKALISELESKQYVAAGA